MQGDVSKSGCVIAVNFFWSCDFSWSNSCEPKMSVKRVDDGTGFVQKRSKKHTTNGISLVPIVIQLGSCLALVQIASMAADFLMERLHLVGDQRSRAREMVSAGIIRSGGAGAGVSLGLGAGGRGSMSTVRGRNVTAQMQFSCEGRDHVAIMSWEAALPRNQTYALRVEATNPLVNPEFNVWTLEVDGLSSAQVAASPVQTFGDVQVVLASPSTRLGGTVGSTLSNGIRIIFRPSVTAESFRITAPMAYNFGFSTQCGGIRFIGQDPARSDATFTQALSRCAASSNTLEITFQVPGGMFAGALYTVEADVLTPQQLPSTPAQFQLSSTLIGGGVGDDIFVDEPSLARGLLYFEVISVSTEPPRSGLTAEVQIKVSFSTLARAGDLVRLILPPRFLFSINETSSCPVTVTSPTVAPSPQCSCQGVLSCMVTLQVLEATTTQIPPNATLVSNTSTTTTTTSAATCTSRSDPAAMLDVWPCGSLLTVRLFTVYPQTVPISFENAWLAEMWSSGVADQTMPTSAGIYQGWQFETAMQDPRVVLGTGPTRAGAVGGVLQIAFVPANAASKLILTAVSPSGWDFQAVDVCETVDEAVVCVRASASANSPNVLILDDISIKAQILFQRELRNVRLASGGGIAEFELATFALGQMGNEVAADSSGSLATWRLPGALEVSSLQLGTYRSVVRDTGDTIFQQLPPRLLLRETVLIIHFSVTQACFPGDILSLEDPTGTFEMFQENATIKQVGNGFMLLAQPEDPGSVSIRQRGAMERLHRFAASLADTRSAQPLVDNACASRANRDSWTYSVFCREVCVAESEDPDATFIPSIDWPLHVTLKEARAEDLLQANPNAVITSYSEWRSKFNEGQYLTLLFYHAFLLLEVEGGLGIWTEKYNDKLELMYGDLETLRAFGQLHRATGEPRKPSLQHSQVTLDAYVTLQDLVDWICGPLAIVWRPYCLINSNCQHYARDLIQFLHDKWYCLRFSQKDDRSLVLAAVSSDGAALAFASKRLRCDKGLALAAVTKCGTALQFCAAFLQEDEDVVFAAADARRAEELNFLTAEAFYHAMAAARAQQSAPPKKASFPPARPAPVAKTPAPDSAEMEALQLRIAGEIAAGASASSAAPAPVPEGFVRMEIRGETFTVNRSTGEGFPE
eukprot:s4726_g1.t3